MPTTTQSRITPLNPPYSADVDSVLNQLMPPGSQVEPLLLFRTLAHNLDLSSRMRPLAAGLLAHGTLEARDRETVILRVCARCGAEYEWGVHVTFFGQMVGFTQATINATVLTPFADPVWSARESLLVQMVDELHDTATISDKLWQSLTQHYTDAQLIELLLVAGFYHAISYVANAARVPIERWAARFPTD